MIELDIQLFGGRGASSSSTANIQQLRETEKNIREKMTKIYNDNSGFARTDLKSVQSAREEWYKLQKDANKIRDKINEEEEKRRKKSTSKNTTKTFVNSYGEATKRYITTSTYERARKRTERAVRRNLGL